jgi:DNA-directed RNA polymerase II subunit RPB2
MTYPATLSHLRRINTPIENLVKLIQPRKLHYSMGYYLSVRNSEGASVGLVKNMAMMSSITISSNSIIREVIKDLGTVIFSHENIGGQFKNTKIIINGDIVRTHSNPLNYSQNSKY